MFCVLVAAVGILAAGIASIAGFGIGSLLTPLLAIELGTKTAVAAVSIPHFIATALRFWKLSSHVDRRVLFGFGLMNAAGSLIGALIHIWINSSALSRVLGCLLIFAGAMGVTGYTDRLRFNRPAAWIAGAFSGAFGGLVGNQGGIRAAAMLGLGVEGPSFVATATAIGLAVDAVRMPIYFATEFHQILAAWPVVAAASLGVIVGTLTGAKILQSIPGSIFRRLVALLLLGIGTFVLVEG